MISCVELILIEPLPGEVFEVDESVPDEDLEVDESVTDDVIVIESDWDSERFGEADSEGMV